MSENVSLPLISDIFLVAAISSIIVGIAFGLVAVFAFQSGYEVGTIFIRTAGSVGAGGPALLHVLRQLIAHTQTS